MDVQPPIPLDYKSPEPKVISRRTSPTTLFASGVGVGFLAICAAAALHGDIDIPIGPACDGVMMVGTGGAIYWLAGRLRTAFCDSLLIARYRLAGFVAGIVCVGAVTAMGYLLPDTATGYWLHLGAWVILSAGSNWITLRQTGRGE